MMDEELKLSPEIIQHFNVTLLCRPIPMIDKEGNFYLNYEKSEMSEKNALRSKITS